MARQLRKLLYNAIIDGEPLERGTLLDIREQDVDERIQELTELVSDDDDGPVRVAAPVEDDDDGKPVRRSRRNAQ
jgi:hypothetical protein